MPTVYTNEQRIAVPFQVLTGQWMPIVREQRELRLAELKALSEAGLKPGPETWAELVEANSAVLSFTYRDRWQSHVAVTESSETGVKLGLVVGAISGGFLWGTERSAKESLTSETEITFEAVLGTATPGLREAVVNELGGDAGMDRSDVVLRAAEALAGVVSPAPTPDDQ